MATPTAAWTSRFSPELSDDEIDARTAVNVERRVELGGQPLEVARAKLDMDLRKLFVPSKQARDVLRELQALARCYDEERYPNQIAFLRNIYASDAEHAEYQPRLRATCLTGLPGVGKTAALSAFERLFEDRTMDAGPDGVFTLRPTWRVTVTTGLGTRQLVTSLFRCPSSLGTGPISIGTIQRELCRQGVASVHGDELQFLSQGTGNALPAKILSLLSRLGPPFLYAANFSLLHRLRSRPQEEKHRLLAKPLFMFPDTPDSSDWTKFLQALFDATPGLDAVTPKHIGEQIWLYSIGIRRLAVNLVVEAYATMRTRGGHTVQAADFDAAYASSAYAAAREDVEVLLAGAEKSSRKRLDLWCPLPYDNVAPGGGKVLNHPAVKEYERRAAHEALKTSLTPVEQQQVKRVNPEPEKPKPRNETRPRATLAGLLEAGRNLCSDP